MIMDLSIVIPVYNSQDILSKLLETIQKKVNFIDNYEVILVNDNSSDGSWLKIVELKHTYPFLKGINLMKNASQHNAIMAGLNEASGEVVVTMDDDLQHNPEDIRSIYQKVRNEGWDVCYTKFTSKKHKSWKLIGSSFNDYVANLLIKKPKDLYLSPFRGMTKQVKDIVVEYNGPYPYVDGLILSVTSHITFIEVEHHQRLIGEGNYTLIKSIALWTKMATGFSVAPLRFATYMGIILSFCSLLLLLLFIIQKFIYDVMPNGWTSIVVLILFFGGIQLFSIGIIGEYIGRTYLNVNKKAQYIIREKI